MLWLQLLHRDRSGHGAILCPLQGKQRPRVSPSRRGRARSTSVHGSDRQREPILSLRTIKIRLAAESSTVRLRLQAIIIITL